MITLIDRVGDRIGLYAVADGADPWRTALQFVHHSGVRDKAEAAQNGITGDGDLSTVWHGTHNAVFDDTLAAAVCMDLHIALRMLLLSATLRWTRLCLICSANPQPQLRIT